MCTLLLLGSTVLSLNSIAKSEDAAMTLTVLPLVKITHMTDFAFGSYTGGASLTSNRNVCIWTNQGSANYKVTANGDGASSAFTLSDHAVPTAHTIAYTTYWNNAKGTSGNAQLTANTITANLSPADTASQTCAGDDNANYEVRISNTVLLAAQPGTYTGVLTFIISPGV